MLDDEDVSPLDGRTVPAPKREERHDPIVDRFEGIEVHPVRPANEESGRVPKDAQVRFAEPIDTYLSFDPGSFRPIRNPMEKVRSRGLLGKGAQMYRREVNDV